MKKETEKTTINGEGSDASACSLCDGLGELEGFGGGGRTECHKCDGTGKPMTMKTQETPAVGCNDLLAELNLSASELLFSSFLYYLNCNPNSTQAFIQDLINGWDWVELPQKSKIKQVLNSAIASDHLDDDQYVIWECCYANLS